VVGRRHVGRVRCRRTRRATAGALFRAPRAARCYEVEHAVPGSTCVGRRTRPLIRPVSTSAGMVSLRADARTQGCGTSAGVQPRRRATAGRAASSAVSAPPQELLRHDGDEGALGLTRRQKVGQRLGVVDGVQGADLRVGCETARRRAAGGRVSVGSGAFKRVRWRRRVPWHPITPVALSRRTQGAPSRVVYTSSLTVSCAVAAAAATARSTASAARHRILSARARPRQRGWHVQVPFGLACVPAAGCRERGGGLGGWWGASAGARPTTTQQASGAEYRYGRREKHDRTPWKETPWTMDEEIPR